MKTLKSKAEITAKNLKEQDCDYQGLRLGFDKVNNLYIIGSHFHSPVVFYRSVKELKSDLFSYA